MFIRSVKHAKGSNNCTIFYATYIQNGQKTMHSLRSKNDTKIVGKGTQMEFQVEPKR